MPPRRQQAAQAAPSLLSLPPEVLQHILASVPLADRLCHVALACKQLGTLCTAPELLSELDVRIGGAHVLQRTQALLRFSAFRSDYVHSLQVSISIDEEDDDEEEVAALVPASLAACAARQAQQGSGLQRLGISSDTPLASVGSLPLLTALEELSLPGRPSSFCLVLDGSLRQLTAQSSAHLSGGFKCRGDGPCLPPSLTRLCIQGDLNDADDAQPPALEAKVLAGLPALRCFELCESPYSEASLAAISSLTTITRLGLRLLEDAPPAAALAALAGTLRALEVHCVLLDEGALDEALRALTGLESLALDRGRWDAHRPSVPPAVATLPRLQRCALTFHFVEKSTSTQASWPPPLAALPFAALRWLALPLQLAVNSHPVLAQAGRLHTLCLILPDANEAFDVAHWTGFWQLVATHPPLRCLLYEGAAGRHPGPDAYLLLDALLLLQRRRPWLEVRRLVGPADRLEHPPARWAELSAC